MQKPWPEINLKKPGGLPIAGNMSGFSLLEVIVAISLLLFGILAVATMQMTTIQGNAFAEGTTEATNLACDRIEKLIQLGMEDFNNSQLQDTDGDGDAGLNDATAGTADFSVTQGRYTILWNVSDNSLLNRTKTINVIVVWSERQGQIKSVSMQHVIPEVI